MLVTVTPPQPVVTLDEVKIHLNVQHDDDDAYISVLIDSAVSNLDGPTGWLNRALGLQTTDYYIDGYRWCSGRSRLRLPLPRLVEVLEVASLGVGGTRTTYDVANYGVYGVGSDQAGFISLNSGSSWPALNYQPYSMVVRYKSGYDYLPDSIRHAIYLMVGRSYNARGEMVDFKLVEDRAINSLLDPHRVY